MLLLSWPPYNEPIGYQIVSRCMSGSVIVYIGEGKWGCTGDDKMHEWLENSCEELYNEYCPHWLGMHDKIFIYKVK